jgi:hypothetical protein
MPHAWLYLDRYKELRHQVLKTQTFCFAARLGTRAFETISGEVVNVSLVGLVRKKPDEDSAFLALDASGVDTPFEKAKHLVDEPLLRIKQAGQLKNPDARVVFMEGVKSNQSSALMSNFAECYQGLRTGDANRFIRSFWEQVDFERDWEFFQSTSDKVNDHVSGLSYAIFWQQGTGQLRDYAMETRDKLHDMHESGNRSWGKLGIAIGQMTLRATRYFGQKFDNTLAVITPLRDEDLSAIWAYCSSSDYRTNLRQIAHGIYVTNQTLLKVPFDASCWRRNESDDGILPPPESADPTQWLFDGQPRDSDHPLQVAVARLVGYQWPRETGSSFPECPALGPDGLGSFTANDGIVPLNPVAGEASAADRLRALLAAAYSAHWSAAKLSELLSKNESLESWLRDRFFEEHCQLFQQRPFVWHVWDGRKDGFHALVNYHKLVASNGEGLKTLEKLLYTTLGDWIIRQRADVTTGIDGADGRLAAAEHLKEQLEKILIGEGPYDIFVRWKPLDQQPIGWEPDINDGVRMNIRPWLMATPNQSGRRDGCILRVTPKIKYGMDRGKEPYHAKEDFPWFWTWDEKTVDFAGGAEFDGARWNDPHYSLSAKQKARDRKMQLERA